MKKSTLALSVAAALAGFGFASGASAMVAAPTGAGLLATGADGAGASAIAVNPRGVGHQLLFPYYTAQSDNATLINITNTDTTSGKVVKVRFRGAANSDDVYDFTLLMSPGDVWSAAVSRDTATGNAKLVSTDTSCVLPATAKNGVFSTTRIDPQNADKPNQTREGYIEVFNMADVPPNGVATRGQAATPAGAAGVDTLFEALKHVNGVAPCTATVLETTLGTDLADNAAARAQGMLPPTTGLMGDWVILNQLNTAAWSGSATALEVRATDGQPVTGNLVVWPQKFGAPSQIAAATMPTVTADQLLISSLLTSNNAGGASAQFYDLPDLSTPYDEASGTSAATQADAISLALSRTTLKHQYATSTDIGAVTDVLFSQPTRRYSVGVNYAATAATDNSTQTTGTTASAIYRGLTLGNGAGRYNAANTGLLSRQVCLDTVTAPNVQGLFDREETSPTTGTTNFVISPNDPTAAAILRLCGETSVVSINQGGVATPSAALSATVARSDVTFASTYTLGWANWDFFSTSIDANGLPILGATFMRAKNGTVNYGFAFPHKN